MVTQSCEDTDSLPDPTTPSRPHALSWLSYLFRVVCVVVVIICLYGLSLGPVARHYVRHPPKRIPGVVMYNFNGARGEVRESMTSVTLPSWVRYVYSPAFRLCRGKSASSVIYRSYLGWCVDLRSECLRNLHQMDEAKRKWASDTRTVDGATPFAAHIIEYLPKRSMPTCPSGGEYHFKPVGTKPECSIHGDNF